MAPYTYNWSRSHFFLLQPERIWHAESSERFFLLHPERIRHAESSARFFLLQPERTRHAERSESNGPVKTKGKGQERSLEWQSQCACTKLKYSTFLCLFLRESICQVKNCLFSKTKANLASWQLKTWFMSEKRHFLVIAWYWKSWNRKWLPTGS